MHTREQKFAARVFEQVTQRAGEYPRNSDARSQYGSMAHKLPILIRTAGLAQALSFLETRGKEPHKELLNDLAAVMETGTGSALVNQSRTASLDQYMILTRHALDALLWYKRFAQSILDVDPSEERNEP